MLRNSVDLPIQYVKSVKRLILFLGLFLWSHIAWASISLVSSTCIAGGTNSATTVAINTTGENFIIASVQYFTGGTLGSISDSQSNAWKAATNWQNSTNGNVQGSIFYYVSSPATGSSHTFTISGTTIYPALCVAAFSGTSGNEFIDAQNGNGNGSSITSITTGSVTPVFNNELIVTSCQIKSTSGSVSIDSGFSIASTAYGNGTVSGASIAYLIQSGLSPVNPTWSFPSNSVGTNIATFSSSYPPTIIGSATISNATIN